MALEGAYAFDDVGAATVVDHSGNGRDITLTGTAGAQVADGGLFDGGGALGKTGATMPVLPVSLLAACETDDRGIMFDAAGNLNVWWVRFEKDSISSGVWGILNISDSVMEVQARRASDEALATRPSATLPGATRTNYCCTYVRSTGVISFYRNGTLASTSSFAAGTQLSIGANRINIAEWTDTGPAMDNLRFFSHAPDATEVDALAGTPVGVAAITGSGAATAPASEASGTGTVTVTGSGAAVASPATAAGTAAVVVSGAGGATGEPGVVGGEASVVVSGSGAAVASPALTSGTGTVAAFGQGTASAPEAVVAGAGQVIVTGSGVVVAPAAVVSGTGGDPVVDRDITLTAVLAPQGRITSSLGVRRWTATLEAQP